MVNSEKNLIMKAAQQVYDQDNYKNRPQPHSGASTISPTAVPVIATSAAKQQDQQYD
jgi:hypothetical protein